MPAPVMFAVGATEPTILATGGVPTSLCLAPRVLQGVFGSLKGLALGALGLCHASLAVSYINAPPAVPVPLPKLLRCCCCCCVC